MKYMLVFGFFFIGITGCASQATREQNARIDEIKTYLATQKPLAQQGKIKWSDYYGGLRVRDINAGVSYDVVHLVSEMMFSAQKFERGEISKEEFDLRKDHARIMMEDIALQERQEAQAQERANRALALQYLVSHPINIPQVQYAPMVQTAIQPIPVLPSPTISFPQAGVTAIWTGNQKQVQTVTNQFGWTCEYNYSGQTFWRTFVSNCPSSVRVQ